MGGWVARWEREREIPPPGGGFMNETRSRERVNTAAIDSDVFVLLLDSDSFAY